LPLGRVGGPCSGSCSLLSQSQSDPVLSVSGFVTLSETQCQWYGDSIVIIIIIIIIIISISSNTDCDIIMQAASTASASSVELSCGEKTVFFSLSDLNISKISKVFGIQNFYLIEKTSNIAFFPNDDGKFDVSNGMKLIVSRELSFVQVSWNNISFNISVNDLEVVKISLLFRISLEKNYV
jgi:hypothetical protein